MTETLHRLLQPFFAPAFVLWGAPVARVEAVAFLLALAMVGCNIRVNPLGWPLAALSSLLYVALFWENRLYGDASLQIFFAAVALWGWWQWLRGRTADGGRLRVTALPSQRRGAVLAVLVVAWPLVGLFLATRTDSDVPWWDAFPTAASLVGQWLLGRKYVENWLVWFGVNCVSVGLFAYKALWLTTLLYAVFAALSLVGWRAWRRIEAAGSGP